MPDRLRDLIINRVAFVGAGDNPHANVVLWKSKREPIEKDYTTAQRAEMAKKGWAIPVKNSDGEIIDGRYPIGNEADLRNAMQALGRAAEGDRAAVIAHIKKNAARLGKTDLLNSDIYKHLLEKDPRLTRSRRQRLADALATVQAVVDEVDRKEVEVGTEKDFQLPADASDELKAFVEGLQTQAADAEKQATEATAKVADLTGRIEKLTAPADERTDVEKALDAVPDETRSLLRKALEDGERARAEAEQIRKARETEAAVAHAAKWDHLSLKPEEFGPVLQKIRAADEDAAAEIERVLDSANAATGFKEIGKGGDATDTDAMEKLRAMASEIAKRDGVSNAVAFNKALDTDEGKELHRQYEEEVSAR